MAYKEFDYRFKPVAAKVQHEEPTPTKQPNRKSLAKKAWWENKRKAEGGAK